MLFLHISFTQSPEKFETLFRRLTLDMPFDAPSDINAATLE